MSEVGRTEKDEKIAELEVWVFRELSQARGAEERRPDRAPAVRFALRRVARLRGREWAGGSDKALGRARTLDVRLRLDTTCRLLVSFLVASSHASCWSSFYT